MMPRLSDVCEGMHGTLGHMQVQCQVIEASLTGFEEHVNLYPLAELEQRMLGLAAWIAASALVLYDQHGGAGHVCLFLTEVTGITLHWVEKEEIVADKTWWQSKGMTVLSVDEAMDLIRSMIHESAAGGWEKAVEWLNKYGKSPGVDFSKLSQMQLLPP